MRLGFLIVAGAVLLAGCETGEAPGGADGTSATSAGEERPFALTDAQARGKVVYETVCWSCHGPAGRGDGPAVQAGSVASPPNFQSGGYATLTAEQLERRFSTGEADSAHPHMQYVRTLFEPQTFSDALAYIPALTYPAEVEGSAIHGKEIYETRCVACHGADGRGEGEAAALLAMAPADFTTDTLVAGSDFQALFRRIREGGSEVHGSSMPPWGILYKDEEIWDLVAYVSTFQGARLDPPPGADR